MSHTIYTIGHSTHSIESFIGILNSYQIQGLIDVRTIPKSRYNPQFAQEELKKSLIQSNINYRHMKNLGGLRRSVKDSPNTGWKNAGFRGYADYMLTDEFKIALDELIELSRPGDLVYMCAEGNPFRCHRSLISDALIVRGFKVRHVSSSTSMSEHQLTRFAKVNGTKIIYPEIQPNLI